MVGQHRPRPRGKGSAVSFDASLPAPYAEDIRGGIEAVNKEGFGAASYQAPAAAEALPFILSKVTVSGGTNVDTVEYPFYGGWSSEALNESPQSIKVEGYISGADLIKRRNALIEAFRKKTTDDAPGYISLPSWGRFPVLVPTWDVEEELNNQGRFGISITFTRAGLSEAARQIAALPSGKSLAASLAAQSAAAVDVFEAALPEENLSPSTMAAGFGALSIKLLTAVGRIQGLQTELNSMTNRVLGIMSLVEQSISAPRTLATALFSAVAAIASGALGIAGEIASYFETDTGRKEGEDRNVRNVVAAFLADSSYLLAVPIATARDLTTRTAIQSLYRAGAFYGAASLLPSIGGISHDRTREDFALLMLLEESIDRDDPSLAAACTDLRISVAMELEALELYRERTLAVSSPMPALALAAELGIPYDRFMSLNNSVEDEFLLRGSLTYV
jgi:prophage DNA circulation protein